MVEYDDIEYIRKNEILDKKIKEENSGANAGYLLDYVKYLELNGRSIATLVSNKGWLNTFFNKFIEKDWKDITQKDMENIIVKINSKTKWSEKHKSNIKKCVKAFDKWFNQGENSDRTRWIKASPQKRKLPTLQRSDLLTDLEKKKLIRSCSNKRDTAIISIWLETGMRPKELRVLKVGSVTVEKDIAWITLPQDTKTGSRPIPIYYSKPHLIDWLNEHPAKDDPNAPLWINTRRKDVLPINRKGFCSILSEIVKRSGIKKRIYWYLGRHTSYTDKASDGWGESIIKQYHGIDQGSSVLNRYVHLSGNDVKNKIREYYGLENEKKKKPILTIVECINCGTENSSANVRCKKCGYIIDPKIMAEELEKKRKAEERKNKELEEIKKQMNHMNKILMALSNERKIKNLAETEMG